jgi:hypothetical protein
LVANVVISSHNPVAFQEVFSVSSPFSELSKPSSSINRITSLNCSLSVFMCEAIELNPNFGAAYHERGRAKLLNGDKDGSIEDIKPIE